MPDHPEDAPTDQHLVHGQSQAQANQSPLYQDADDRAPEEGQPPADAEQDATPPKRQAPDWEP